MTTLEIINGIQLIHEEVAVLKAETENEGKNALWLSVAKGALLTAIHQVQLHGECVEKPAAAPAPKANS